MGEGVGERCSCACFADPQARMGKGSQQAVATRREDFLFSEQEEPHASRKTAILKAHPEIKQLMGPEPLTKWAVFATVALQVYMAQWTLKWSWGAYLAAVYVVGATVNHPSSWRSTSCLTTWASRAPR